MSARSLAWVCVLAGCKPTATEPVAAPTPGVSADAGARRDALVQVLSAHDGAPACEALPGGDAQLREDLAWIVSAPVVSTAAMRAAGCIVDRYADDEAALLQRWVADPDTLGLALLVAGRIDTLPEAVAVDVARAGLAGPHAERLAARWAAAQTPAVRALVDD